MSSLFPAAFVRFQKILLSRTKAFHVFESRDTVFVTVSQGSESLVAFVNFFTSISFIEKQKASHIVAVFFTRSLSCRQVANF